MANGDKKSSAAELEAVARIVEAALGGKQAGKNSVTEAQDAAAEGYGDPGNWEGVEAKYNLQIYSKNNRFYFGPKGKPADIDWLEVGDRLDVGDRWAYPIYSVTAGGATVKTFSYELKKVKDPTLFKGTTGERDANRAISERGLLGLSLIHI